MNEEEFNIKAMGELLQPDDPEAPGMPGEDIKDLKDADVFFVVDRDTKPDHQQRTLIRLGSKLNRSLEYNFNIITKEASVFKMYSLIGMAHLYGYVFKVQVAYNDGSVPKGVLIVCEAGDNLSEVARTLDGLPSIGCS